MNESIWLLAGYVSVLFFSSVIHCAKCWCAEWNGTKRSRRWRQGRRWRKQKHISTQSQGNLFIMFRWSFKDSECTPNHNMFKDVKAPNEHNAFENRYIKRVEWDSFTKSQSYQKGRKECAYILRFVFLLIIFLLISNPLIDRFDTIF